MIVTIDVILNIYDSLLKGTLSYSEADRWAWDVMQKSDAGNLQFDPLDKESLIWDLISFLYGIDIPDMDDKTKYARTNLDVIEFLKKKEIYEMVKDIR